MLQKRLYSENKYPIIQLLTYGWAILIPFSNSIGFNHPWTTFGAIFVQLILIYFSLISVDTIITENEIIQGDNYGFIKKLHKQKRIARNEFIDVSISQNEKKYYDIHVNGKDGSKILMKRIPNLNPAKAELEQLTEKIAQNWNSTNSF